MTLMTASDSEGTRRCDAHCYNAKGEKCTCCCGGKNHGKGLQAALRQSAKHAHELLRRSGIVIQGDLFAEVKT
jgi:hypothetical protein